MSDTLPICYRMKGQKMDTILSFRRFIIFEDWMKKKTVCRLLLQRVSSGSHFHFCRLLQSASHRLRLNLLLLAKNKQKSIPSITFHERPLGRNEKNILKKKWTLREATTPLTRLLYGSKDAQRSLLSNARWRNFFSSRLARDPPPFPS